MSRRRRWHAVLALTALVATAGCGGDQRCGPSTGVVASVVDGDTIRLESGETLRYLMVDSPETTNGNDECWGVQARAFNQELVLGREVTLKYDQQCADHRDRLLAHVAISGRDVSSRLVELGHACVLHIAPNGDDRLSELTALEEAARGSRRGLWSCATLPRCAR